MKITIIQGAFLPVPTKLGGAVEKMWFALSKEFVAAGHEVVYISRLFEDFPKEEVIDGVRHLRVKGHDTPASSIYLKWLDLLYTIRAKKLIHNDTDVIVSNSFFTPIILSQALKRKIMVDVQRMPKGQLKYYTKSARLRANSTPVAMAIKNEIEDEFHEKVTMIPNPLPFSNLPTIDFANKKKEILYAGRVHPEKGLEILIEAFDLLDTDWKLIIVGPWDTAAGGGGEGYLSSLRKISSNPNIEFVGPVYDIQQLNNYYANAAIFAYPSVAEKGETFGLAPLEAMAWGAVPIVSDLACFKDFIKHDSNGLIFNHRSEQRVNDLKTLIVNLQSDKDKMLKLSTAAMDVRQSHSTRIIAHSFLKEFESIVREH